MSNQKADKAGYESIRRKHQEDIASQGADEARYDRTLVERTGRLPGLYSDQQDKNHRKWFEHVNVMPRPTVFSANM